MSSAALIDFEFDADQHLFTRQGRIVPSTTFVLASAGICDFSFVEESLRERAKIRGKSVHWLLELDDQEALDYRRVPIALRGYRRGYTTWKRQSHFLPILIEKKFVSHFGYAGIVDRVGTFPATSMYLSGTTAVLDFKTGDIPDWCRYQLAAYAVGIEPNLSVARTIRRIGLSLKPDGTYKVREFPLCTFDSDFSRFHHELRKLK